jgi:hypothetical protein
VNRYCALFHAAFWLKDLAVLRSLLVSLLTVNAVLNNAVEVGMPMVKSYFNRMQNKQKDQKEKAKGELEKQDSNSSSGSKRKAAAGEGGSNASAVFVPGASTAPDNSTERKILEEELAKTDYDLNSDYLEIVLQYGYVTMFVVAFPLAPALALLNNVFEAKVDLFKLTECRRPTILQRSTIGSWQSCMEFISFLSVITNCYLVVMVSTHFEMIIPEDLVPYMATESGRCSTMRCNVVCFVWIYP